MSRAIRDLGTKAKSTTESLQPDRTGKVQRAHAKQVVDSMADHMSSFSRQLKLDLVAFSGACRNGLTAVQKTSELALDFGRDGLTGLQSNLGQLQILSDSIPTTRGQIGYLRERVARLPRLTTRLNKAKRSCVSVLDALQHEQDLMTIRTTSTMELVTEVIQRVSSAQKASPDLPHPVGSGAQQRLHKVVREARKKRVRWILVLDGVLNEYDRARVEAIVERLRKVLDDPHITIKRIDEGSVVIHLESARQAFEQAKSLHSARRLSDLLDVVVERVGESQKAELRGKRARHYRPKQVTLHQLWRTRKTEQRSLDALRQRTREGLLVFIEKEGRLNMFDEVLSLIRLNAADMSRLPGITWQRIGRTMKALDEEAINQQLIDLLNAGTSNKRAVQFLAAKIMRSLDY